MKQKKEKFDFIVSCGYGLIGCNVEDFDSETKKEWDTILEEIKATYYKIYELTQQGMVEEREKQFEIMKEKYGAAGRLLGNFIGKNTFGKVNEYICTGKLK